jgi:hypothetical protein
MSQTPWDDVVGMLSTEMLGEPTHFFATFSRFEWALGNEGNRFTKSGTQVGINWDKVGQAFGKSFYDKVEADETARRLIDDPPLKLTNGGTLGLIFDSNPIACGDASAVFNALARIRNNLFHGYKNGIEADDRQHIANGLAVMRVAYDFCDQHPQLRLVTHHMTKV